MEFLPGIAREFYSTLDQGRLCVLNFSYLFTVSKGQWERHLILDLSTLNLLLKKLCFKMEDLRKVPRFVSMGLWAVKLDLKGAYFHLYIALRLVKYLGFAPGERIFMLYRRNCLYNIVYLSLLFLL